MHPEMAASSRPFFIKTSGDQNCRASKLLRKLHNRGLGHASPHIVGGVCRGKIELCKRSPVRRLLRQIVRAACKPIIAQSDQPDVRRMPRPGSPDARSKLEKSGTKQNVPTTDVQKTEAILISLCSTKGKDPNVVADIIHNLVQQLLQGTQISEEMRCTCRRQSQLWRGM